MYWTEEIIANRNNLWNEPGFYLKLCNFPRSCMNFKEFVVMPKCIIYL